MKTTIPKDAAAQRGWVLIDAADRPLGRVAVLIANTLRGKNKVTYTPHVDTGDFVVVVNADKVRLTGKKELTKTYDRYTRWPGGLKTTTAAALRQRHPDQLIRLAVKGMLPKNHLSRMVFSKLKVYAGAEHPHAAQAPRKVEMP